MDLNCRLGKGDKFLELENYFKSCLKEKISLTFNEIEYVLGFSLSPSAYDYVAYWNEIGRAHV